MDILYLTLKKKWFDMILSGEKREEYRDIKPYWDKRINGRTYEAIRFRNGYGDDKPTMMVEFKGVEKKLGNTEWGAPKIPVYSISLGKVLYTRNIN